MNPAHAVPALVLLAAAAEQADVAMLVLDGRLRPVVCNRKLRALSGQDDRPFVPGEFPGVADLRLPDGQALPDGPGLFELIQRHGVLDARLLGVVNERTGELRRVLVQGRQVRDEHGQAVGIVMTMTEPETTSAPDATGRELLYLAEHDELTGLLNRRGFLGRGQRELERLLGSSRRAAVWTLDVDGLKKINDSSGHAAGDMLLRAVADAARAVAVDHGAVVGRLGGDEFVLLADAHDGIAAEMVLAARRQRLLHRLPWPVEITVGVAVAPSGGDDDLMALVGRADDDMYRQRRSRRSDASAPR